MSKPIPAIFNQKTVRRVWDEEREEWYFSVIDVVAVLTNQPDYKKAKSYWTTLKGRLKKEGSEVVTKCDQLKMEAADGKSYLTDVASPETLLRLIQSIPSPRAEPFKLWLARVGHERIEENANPELSIDRAMQTYLAKGYSKVWINQRLKSIEIRKELTDEWEERGVKRGQEFAILTDEVTKGWSGKSVKDYKKLKGLKKEGLRDNMTNLELVLNMLAEATTTEISKEKKAQRIQGKSKSRADWRRNRWQHSPRNRAKNRQTHHFCKKCEGSDRRTSKKTEKAEEKVTRRTSIPEYKPHLTIHSP